jgi:hypothetical protein
MCCREYNLFYGMALDEVKLPGSIPIIEPIDKEYTKCGSQNTFGINQILAGLSQLSHRLLHSRSR